MGGCYECPCLLDADRCLRSDVIPDSRSRPPHVLLDSLVLDPLAELGHKGWVGTPHLHECHCRHHLCGGRRQRQHVHTSPCLQTRWACFKLYDVVADVSRARSPPLISGPIQQLRGRLQTAGGVRARGFRQLFAPTKPHTLQCRVSCQLTHTHGPPPTTTTTTTATTNTNTRPRHGVYLRVPSPPPTAPIPLCCDCAVTVP